MSSVSKTLWGDWSNYRSQKLFKLALLLSVLLHGIVLFLNMGAPGLTAQSAKNAEDSPPARLEATLAPQKVPQLTPLPLATPPPRVMAKHRDKHPRQTKILSVPRELTTNRSWTVAERDEMDQFLNELKPAPPAPTPPPKTGFDLSRQALAIAKSEGRRLQKQGEATEAEVAAAESSVNSKAVEPFSLQMYFDAFVRKLNQSSAFVKNDPRNRGTRKALVQILLKPDGTLKSYRVLRAADQQVQIAYIKQVIDLASPFSAFPQDIRQAMESFSVLICIYPPREGEGGGGFTRSFGSHDCD